MKCSSLLPQLVILLLLICVFPCHSKSAPFSVTELTHENSHGRSLYQSAKPASFKVKVRALKGKGQALNSKESSRSMEKTHQLEGRRLMGIYYPNAGIRAGPSKSGQGGGRNPVAAP
ncbi:uncharacterized protein LOC17875750 [Capsella rubella]|nr:uncharacterized protein LOC17875750 [Capsella rubella]